MYSSLHCLVKAFSVCMSRTLRHQLIKLNMSSSYLLLQHLSCLKLKCGGKPLIFCLQLNVEKSGQQPKPVYK